MPEIIPEVNSSDVVHNERIRIARKIREKKVPLFSTEKSIEAVIEKLGLKGEIVVAVMVVTNTLLEIMAKEIEDGNLSE